jgi:CheY-like chemotaxis protein
LLFFVGPYAGERARGPSGSGPRVRGAPADGNKRLRPRLLIVEDHAETRDMYAWYMRAGGWRVEEAANGEEALFLAGSFEPDVIVMDLALPVLDGIEATRRLRMDARTRRTPIVVCTALAHPHAWEQAKRAGCNAFVTKPCSPDDLGALLESLLALPPDPSS